MKTRLVHLAVLLIAGGTLGHAAQQHAAAVPEYKQEVDVVEPTDLKALVKQADAVVVAQLIGRTEPRRQTTPLQIRGKTVQDTKIFARYVIRTLETIKAPKGLSFDGELVIEEWILDDGLARFNGGFPDVGTSPVLFFLEYYPPGNTFLLSTWRWQIRRTQDGAAQPVAGSTLAGFQREHPILGAAASERRADGWDMLVSEVRALARAMPAP